MSAISHKKQIIFTVVLLLVGYIAGHHYFELRTQEQIQQAIDQAELNTVVQFERLSLSHITMIPILHEVVIKNNKAQPLLLDTVTLYQTEYDPAQQIAELDVSYQLKTVPMTQAPEAFQRQFGDARYGIEHYGGEGLVKIKMVEGELSLNVDTTMNEVMHIQLASQVHYEPAWLEQMQQAAADNTLSPFLLLQSLDKVSLERLKLHIDDLGALTTLSQQSPLSEAARHEKVQQGVIQAGLVSANAPETKTLTDTLVAFLANPQALTVTLSPPAPTTMLEMWQLLQYRQFYQKMGMSLDHAAQS